MVKAVVLGCNLMSHIFGEAATYGVDLALFQRLELEPFTVPLRESTMVDKHGNLRDTNARFDLERQVTLMLGE